MNFSDLMSTALETSDNIRGTIPQIETLANQGVEIANERAAAAANTADAASRIAAIELEDKARIEKARKDAAGQIGTDPSQVGYMIGAYADRAKQADQRMMQASAKIKEIDSMSFLENPVGFLYAQLVEKKPLVAEYNAAVRDGNSADSIAATLAKLTEDQFKTVNALTSTVSDSYIKAATIVAADQYNAKASDAKLQATRLNLEGIQLATQASSQALQIEFSANNAQMQQLQYQNSLEQLRMAKASFNLQKQAYDEKQTQDDLIVKYVAMGHFAQTGRQMDPAKSKEIVAAYKMGKSPDIMNWFNAGVESSMVGVPVISSSPYDAATLYSTNKVQNLPAAQKEVADQLVTWRRTWENSIEGKTLTQGKDKTAAERAFNFYVSQQVNSGQSPVHKPLALKETATYNKFIGSLPVWKAVLEPAVNSGVNIDDPNIAFGLITSAVQGGKLSYLDAVDYSTAVAAGLKLNNQARNFLTFGVEPRKVYEAGVSMPMSLGKTSVNFADRKSFGTALNTALAKAKLKSIAETAGPTGSATLLTGMSAGVEAGMAGFDNLANSYGQSMKAPK